MSGAAVHQLPGTATPKKILIAKVRFREHLDARNDLSDLQRRVGGRIASLYNVNRGIAWPSYDALALDLGATKRGVIKAVAALEGLGLIRVRKRGGRGLANEYVPAFDRVPDGCPYAAERVNRDAKRVNGGAENSECQYTPSCISPVVINHPFRPKAAAASAARPPTIIGENDYECDLLKASVEGFESLHQLRALERDIKRGRLSRMFDVEREQLEEMLESCVDAFDGKSGAPIGGVAYRLLQDVQTYCESDEA